MNKVLVVSTAWVAVFFVGCDGGSHPGASGGGSPSGVGGGGSPSRVGGGGSTPPGVGGGGGSSGHADPGYWSKTSSALVSFSTANACADAQKYVADELSAQMVKSLDGYRSCAKGGTCWGWGGGASGSGGGSASGGGSGTGGGNSSGPNAYTTTNDQVQGVDEPDIMKNDGTRVFVLANQKLYSATSWPPENLATVGSVALSTEEWSQEMFLEGNHVAVLGSKWDYDLQTYDTLITMIDVSNLAAPTVVGRYTVPGWYLSARMIGSSVRVVTSWALQTTPGVQYYYWPSQQGETAAQIDAEVDALIAKNNQLIYSRTLDQWLGSTTWADQNGHAKIYPVDCGSLAHSGMPVTSGATNIVTVDLEDQTAFDRQTLLEDTDLIYASQSSLYLVSRDWWWWWDNWFDPSANEQWDGRSVIHKFDISSSTKASYVASGEVDGFPLTQYALDEDNGLLRVAMTSYWWSGGAKVEVLSQTGNQLVVVGSTPQLASGESLTGVRFAGSRAFLSTFRNTDPFIAVDLSNPLEPTVAGQLVVPGFTTFLQPIDANHLLAVGEYVPVNQDDWVDRHVQLSLYDVSDLTSPKLVATQMVGSYQAQDTLWQYGWGWSEAVWDPHAFNYFATKGLVAVPFYWWQESCAGGYSACSYRTGSEVDVYRVDAATGFTSLGALNMNDVRSPSPYWWTDSFMRRSVMADDYVYAVGTGGIRVANNASLDTPIATAIFAQ